MVKRELVSRGVQLDSLGAAAHFTGGCSMLRGSDELAQEIFGVPAHLPRVKGIMGESASAMDNPHHSCAIGLANSAKRIASCISFYS